MANLDKIVAAGVESFDDIKDDCFRDLMKAAAFSILQQLREEFIKNDCTACGGNWTAMILTGIKKRWPEYFESMPDKSYNFIEAIEISDNKLIAEYLLQHPISD